MIQITNSATIIATTTTASVIGQVSDERLIMGQSSVT
jgi:hypothetical protein